MATVKKHNGKWRAQVNKRTPDGARVRKSKTCKSKTEAQTWSTRLEMSIDSGQYIPKSDNTLGDLLNRYREKVTSTKKSKAWERKKIDHIVKHFGYIRLDDLNAPAIADWRDTRLKAVKPATVNREWNLLNAAINTAIREWEWLTVNPMTKVKRPPKTRPRDRLISNEEIKLMIEATGFKNCPDTVASRVGAAFLFAIETAMRQAEISSLCPDTVDLNGRVCELPETKNGTKRRVPLSTRAIELLELVNSDFKLKPSQIDSNFRKYRDRVGIEDLHFHDSRHQAITNLAQKVEVLNLARITGITDLKVLMVYYNQTAEEIAKLLD